MEGKLCAGQEVALVGAGNSAGQAVVYLASQVAKVWLLVRGPSLEASMSRYLVDRIAVLPNVEVLVQTEVSALEGQGGILEAIRWRHLPSGQETRRPTRHIFLFIGAEPNTGMAVAIRSWRSTTKASCARAQSSRMGTGRSRRVATAYLRSATCGPDRSSGSPLPSAKVPRWWRRFTPFWPTSGDHSAVVANPRRS